LDRVIVRSGDVGHRCPLRLRLEAALARVASPQPVCNYTKI
jgi:hypothetical protein